MDYSEPIVTHTALPTSTHHTDRPIQDAFLIAGNRQHLARSVRDPTEANVLLLICTETTRPIVLQSFLCPWRVV